MEKSIIATNPNEITLQNSTQDQRHKLALKLYQEADKYLENNECEKAIILLEQALDICPINFSFEQLYFRILITQALAKEKRLDEADRYLTEAKQRYKQINDEESVTRIEPDLFYALYHLGFFYREKNTTKAIIYFKEALDFIKNCSAVFSVLVNRYLADLFLKSNDLNQANNFWQDAFNALEKLTETKDRILESEQLAILAFQLGENHLQVKNKSDARIFFEHAVLLTANLKLKPHCFFLALDNLTKLYQRMNPSIATIYSEISTFFQNPTTKNFDQFNKQIYSECRMHINIQEFVKTANFLTKLLKVFLQTDEISGSLKQHIEDFINSQPDKILNLEKLLDENNNNIVLGLALKVKVLEEQVKFLTGKSVQLEKQVKQLKIEPEKIEEAQPKDQKKITYFFKTASSSTSVQSAECKFKNTK